VAKRNLYEAQFIQVRYNRIAVTHPDTDNQSGGEVSVAVGWEIEESTRRAFWEKL
jgi:hypothetical protein